MADYFKKKENFNQRPLRMTVRSEKGEIICPHWHGHHEFIYIEDGNLTVYINSKMLNAKNGDIIYVSPYSLHRGIADSKCTIRGFVIPVTEWSFDSSEYAPFCSNYEPLINSEKVGGILNEIAEEYNSDEYDNAEVLRAYIKLLRIYTARIIGRGNTNVTANSATVKSSAEYIKDNFSYAISMEDIAKNVNLSKFHFSRLFKEVTGITPMEYLKNVRVQNAVEMMELPGLTITEISSRCGFSSPGYFNKVFKKSTGFTPYEYKKLTGKVS